MFTRRVADNFTFGSPQHFRQLQKNAHGTLFNMSRQSFAPSSSGSSRSTMGSAINTGSNLLGVRRGVPIALNPTTPTNPSNPTTPTTPAEPVDAQPTQQQQFFDDVNNQGYHTPMDQQQLAERAAQFRQVYEAPQREALTRQLEEAIMNAENQEASIRSNYASYMDSMNQHMDLQRRRDLESAIARGAGRSGVVDYDTIERERVFAPQISGTKAQKMAELNAIANQLALERRQVPRQIQELAEQASRLEAQELQRLMDLDYDRGRDYDMDQFARSLNIFDRTRLTPLEQLEAYLGMASIKGNFPSGVPDVYGNLP